MEFITCPPLCYLLPCSTVLRVLSREQLADVLGFHVDCSLVVFCFIYPRKMGWLSWNELVFLLFFIYLYGVLVLCKAHNLFTSTHHFTIIGENDESSDISSNICAQAYLYIFSRFMISTEALQHRLIPFMWIHLLDFIIRSILSILMIPKISFAAVYV